MFQQMTFLFTCYYHRFLIQTTREITEATASDMRNQQESTLLSTDVYNLFGLFCTELIAYLCSRPSTSYLFLLSRRLYSLLDAYRCLDRGLEAQKSMPVRAGRSERQPPVGRDAGHLHDPARVHYPHNVQRVPSLLVCNERSQVVVPPRPTLIPPVCSKRTRSAQKPPANTNSNLTVCVDS
jgi:hypothetical protein